MFHLRKNTGLFAKPVKIRTCSLKTVAERLRGCLLGCMYRQGESFSTSVVSHVQRGSPRVLIQHTRQAALHQIAHVGKYTGKGFRGLFSSSVLFLSQYSSDLWTSWVKSDCFLSSCFSHLLIPSSHIHTGNLPGRWLLRENSLCLSSLASVGWWALWQIMQIRFCWQFQMTDRLRNCQLAGVGSMLARRVWLGWWQWNGDTLQAPKSPLIHSLF